MNDPRQSSLILPGSEPIVDPRYGCVITDNPWRFKNVSSRAAAENHYETLSIRKLEQLPVDDWVRPNAHLYMWVVDSVLDDVGEGSAFTIMKRWGFTFKMTLCWAKINTLGKIQMGMGNYVRHAHELLLFGVRGKAPALDRSQLSFFWGPRGQHSRKPDNVHEIAEKVSPGPYLEMFARRNRPGWTSWGDQAPPAFSEKETQLFGEQP